MGRGTYGYEGFVGEVLVDGLILIGNEVEKAQGENEQVGMCIVYTTCMYTRLPS